MLEPKYLNCPLFDEVLGISKKIGKWYIGYYYGPTPFFTVSKTKREEGDVYDCVYLAPAEHYNHYSSYSNSEVFMHNHVEITEQLAKLISENLSTVHKISEIIRNRFTFDDYDDTDYNLDLVYLTIYYFWKWLNSEFDDSFSIAAIMSSGVKCVLNHVKGQGLREIELNNGQVWLVKRNKVKGYKGNYIRHRNKRGGFYLYGSDYHDKGPKKSTWYTLIKRIR